MTQDDDLVQSSGPTAGDADSPTAPADTYTTEVYFPGDPGYEQVKAARLAREKAASEDPARATETTGE